HHVLRELRARTRAAALRLEEPAEPRLVDRQSRRARDLARHLEREAERVEEPERRIAIDPGVAGRLRRFDRHVELLEPVLERALELLLFGAEDLRDAIACARELGVGLLHVLHDLDPKGGEHAGPKAEPSAVQGRAPDEATKHVAAPLV